MWMYYAGTLHGAGHEESSFRPGNVSPIVGLVGYG